MDFGELFDLMFAAGMADANLALACSDADELTDAEGDLLEVGVRAGIMAAVSELRDAGLIEVQS